MFICCNCKEVIDDDEVKYEEVCWEDYYGVGSMFPDRHYGEFAICPYCGSDELDDYFESDDDDEEDDEEYYDE